MFGIGWALKMGAALITTMDLSPQRQHALSHFHFSSLLFQPLLSRVIFLNFVSASHLTISLARKRPAVPELEVMTRERKAPLC